MAPIHSRPRYYVVADGRVHLSLEVDKCSEVLGKVDPVLSQCIHPCFERLVPSQNKSTYILIFTSSPLHTPSTSFPTCNIRSTLDNTLTIVISPCGPRSNVWSLPQGAERPSGPVWILSKVYLYVWSRSQLTRHALAQTKYADYRSARTTTRPMIQTAWTM